MSCKTTKTYVFDWDIENFSCCDWKEKLCSPPFYARDLQKTKWYVELIFRSSESAYCEIARATEDGGRQREKMSYTLGYVGCDGSLIRPLSGTRNFRYGGIYECDGSESFFQGVRSNLISIKDVKRWQASILVNDVFRIRLKIWNGEDNSNNTIVQFWGITIIDCKRAHTDWTVKSSSKGKLKSTFEWSKSRNLLNMKIQLVVNDSLRFLVKPVNEDIAPVTICSVYLLDTVKGLLLIDTFEIKMEEFRKIKEFDILNKNTGCLRWNDLINLKSSHSSTDVITIRTELVTSYGLIKSTYVKNQRVEVRKPFQAADDPSKRNLLNSLWAMREEGTFCDATLATATASFPVHRIVLAAKSSAFKCMFMTDMREKASNRVVITDLDDGTINLMLRYAYTGEVGLDWDKALKLVFAADKYDIPDLLDLCSDYIEEYMSLENACDVLVAADMHYHQQLMDLAISFISSRRSEVFKTMEWNKLQIMKPNLAIKVYRQVME